MKVTVRLKREFWHKYYQSFHGFAFEADVEPDDVKIEIIDHANGSLFPIEHWEIVSPAPKILKGTHETREEIWDRLANHNADPVGAAAKEIFELHDLLHLHANENEAKTLQREILEERAETIRIAGEALVAAVRAFQDALKAGGKG